MITHVCPTCRRRHELSDDYEGIIFVCTVCQKTAEVRLLKNHITIPVEQEKPWHAQEIWPDPLPAPTRSDVPWNCPRCSHFGHAVIRSGGLSEAGFMLILFPIFSFLLCVFGHSLIGLELVWALIILSVLDGFLLFVILLTDGGKVLKRYSAHCEKCGYWFR